MAITSFHPPVRTLMGPGPSDVSPRVLEALSRPTIGHLDPEFGRMMEELKSLMRDVFITRNDLTFPVSGPGSAGMETCFVNLVEPGDKVIICQNGVFGGRMRENVERVGGLPVMVMDDWGRAVDVRKLEQALIDNPDASMVAFVHAETSTGALSDAAAIGRLAREHGCLVIADTVTSLGGVELKVDEWGLDAVYSGTQKCLSCIPGLSPVTFSPRAVAKLKARKTAVPSWFLDLSLVVDYWTVGSAGKRSYHHTAPVNDLYALHESLVMVMEEGLESSWRRHAFHHGALRAGLEAMGMSFVVPESERLPQLNSVTIPAGVDDATVRAALLTEFNLEIGAGLGELAGKVWRIGLMGAGCHRSNVTLCVSALESVLISCGASVESGASLKAVAAYYDAKEPALAAA